MHTAATFCLALTACHASVHAQCEPQWTEGFNYPGTNFSVSTFLSGGEELFGKPMLVMGGAFWTAGPIAANSIAMWDGENWNTFGEGMNGSVRALEIFDDGNGPALYAAGGFTMADGAPANRIAKWNGASWEPLGDGLDNVVNAIKVFDDGSGNGPELYAGGTFDTAGGLPASSIAKWDGSSWSDVGGGILRNASHLSTVRALEVFDDGSGPALYAGGYFAQAGNVSTPNLARWNGVEWSTVGGGIPKYNSIIYSLAVFEGNSKIGPVLVCGRDAESNALISAWDGIKWMNYLNDFNGEAYAFTVRKTGKSTSDILYVGGNFKGDLDSDDIDETRDVAMWDGTTWSGFSNGANSAIYALKSLSLVPSQNQKLFAGGLFTSIGNVHAWKLAQWDGRDWTPVIAGNGGIPTSNWAVFNGDCGKSFYANFSGGPGNIDQEGFGRWDGKKWIKLGPEISEGTTATFDDGSGEALYAIGAIPSEGWEDTQLFKWDSPHWLHVSDAPGLVRDLTGRVEGKGIAIYAGGAFRTYLGNELKYVGKWDGSEWSPLGGGTNGPVDQLVFFDDGTGPALYAAGSFTAAGGISANYVAKWDGQSWSELGPGVQGSVFNPIVFSLTAIDFGNGPAWGLYIGGFFQWAGYVPADGIARWNGTAWSRLGGGIIWDELPGFTIAYASTSFRHQYYGNDPVLAVGGTFTTADGQPANRVAIWDGTVWHSLADGVDHHVYDIAAIPDASTSGESLYVSGRRILIAGGMAVGNFARWGCPYLPSCEADIAPQCRDYVVNVDDLLAAIGMWGPCVNPNCHADVIPPRRNGRVDIDDLLGVLAQWGYCPCDPSGTWNTTPTIQYECALGNFSVDLNEWIISQTDKQLTIQSGDLFMTGSPSSCVPGGAFLVTASEELLPGCTVTYTLTGSFTRPTEFTGTFSIDFNGLTCVDCENQSFPVTATPG